jgi:hypothetical protein
VTAISGDERWRDEPGFGACLRRLGDGATVQTLLEAKARGELPPIARRLEQPLRPAWLGDADR